MKLLGSSATGVMPAAKVAPRAAGRRRGLIAALGVATLVTLGAPVAVRAAPVPEAQRIPVDLRRTTLVVRDIEKSLPLYRDALGFRVIYDEKIGPGPDGEGRPQPPTVRLVLLRANDDFIGVLGLMQRLRQEPPPPPPRFGKAQAGDAILVINVADLDTRFARVRATPWVTVAEEPERIDYPAPGGQGTIPVLFSAVWDADGNFIELNKILGTPAGQPRAATAGPARGEGADGGAGTGAAADSPDARSRRSPREAVR